MNNKIYFDAALAQIPRVLGLCDRNIMSPTYGCFDRDYWHYKRVDTPFARMQENVLSLALVYKNKGSRYYKNKYVLDIIKAGINYWVKIQHNDGSFSDFYPNERAIVVTSFSLYAVCKTLLILPNLANEETNKKILEAIDKAADFLVRNVEKNAINQEISSVAALCIANKLLKTAKLNSVIEGKLKYVLDKQSKEGWFPEYGGIDIGYLSVAISYMAKTIENLDKEKYKKLVGKLKNAMDKSISTISYFIHPDGSAGGEYSSRNTQYIIPYGIEFASFWNKTAVSIKTYVLANVENSKTNGLYNLDDRYMCLYLYEYLLSYYHSLNNKKANQETGSKLPYEQDNFEKLFREAEIFIKKQNNSYLIIGLKNAIIKYFYNNKLLCSDAGYIYDSYDSERLIAASGCYGSSEYNITKNGITIKKYFNEIKYRKSSTLMHLGLRVLTFKGVLSKILRRKVLKTLLKEGRKTDVVLVRNIRFGNNSLEIFDKIESKKIVNLYKTNEFNYRYIPSAQYFNMNLLNTHNTFVGQGSSFSVSRKIENGKEKVQISRTIKQPENKTAGK